jgi:hypothetical protein
MNKEDCANLILIEMVVLVIFLSLAGLILKQKEPEYEPPLQEIPTVIVRIADKNNVIHSREGMLLDGVVIVELSGK